MLKPRSAAQLLSSSPLVSLLVAHLLILAAPLSGLAQADAPAPPIPMPGARAADSYAIYSQLLPLGETAGNGWPHQLWLVQDATVSLVPLNQPCSSPPGKAPSLGDSMNPHVAVHPTPGGEQDYAEVLDDFDRHCHERLALERNAWKLSAPLRLLNDGEQAEFQASRFGVAKEPSLAQKYKGAPALYGFSEVYFNAHHTVALVYATHWCGGLCGEGFWVAFTLVDGSWQRLKWSSNQWIS